MNHVIAVLGLAALCALWYAVQRFTGREAEGPCASCAEPGCDRRDAADPACRTDPESVAR